MKVLIVNTGRFGDTIQSVPLILGLKKKYPECKIFYLCLENFKSAAEIIPEIDLIIPINFSSILKSIDNNFIDHAYIELKKIFNEINFKFDILINISFSTLSAVISSIINASEKKGLILNEKNEFVAYDNWSKFFLAIVNNRISSPFNLVDIFSKIGGVVSEKIRISLPKNIKNIGFQMGASTYDRRWPVEKFSQLAKLILERDKNIKIYLFGSKNEIELSQRFESYFNHSNIINLIGKTSIIDLYKILKDKIDVLITNDTGTMHLAWYAGKKVIELSLGPALYNTTGPVGEGHIVIQPDIECSPCSYQTNCLNLNCHNLVSPELINSIIFEEEIISGEQVKILKTKYDSDDFLSYEKVYGNDDEFIKNRDSLKKIWINILENKKFKIEENDKLMEINSLIDEIFKLLNRIYKESNIYEINLLWEKITHIENILKKTIVSNYKQFEPFYKYFELLKNFNEKEDFYTLIRNYESGIVKLKYAINNFC